MESGSRSLSGGQKALYNAIRKYMSEAETELRVLTIQRLGAMMPNDPRGAHYSVSRDKVRSKKGTIYGQIKILQPKTAGSVKASYVPTRKLDENPHQRGGNRRPRSARTIQIMSYGPRDRGFILRFLESGTAERHTRNGNRGSITARPRFARAAQSGFETVVQNLAAKIDNKIRELVSQGRLETLD